MQKTSASALNIDHYHCSIAHTLSISSIHPSIALQLNSTQAISKTVEVNRQFCDVLLYQYEFFYRANLAFNLNPSPISPFQTPAVKKELRPDVE